MEVAESGAKNGAHNTCKNCTDVDFRGSKEKGGIHEKLGGERKKIWKS